MKTLIIATKNKGKVKEIVALLSDMDLEVKSLLDFDDIPDILENVAVQIREENKR